MRRSPKDKDGEPSPSQNFEQTMKKILAVSKDELDRREKEWKEERAKRKGA